MSTELGKAYVQIVPSAKGIGSSIATELGGSAGDAGVSAGKLFGAKFKQIVGALGLGKIALDAFREGAGIEQAIGGIQTLYKTSADEMIKNADNAWKTAGMTARTYMETATKFSASLLNSLGGDTVKAAKIADRAIIDMSDNANKFGTDIESIQNAYQGFAKGNYTMLDNLSLGFAGTKSGMLDLISEASKMTKEQKELNVTIKDGDLSFANIANAISVVQKKMGIMGTTADEADKTLSGSFNSMKASWTNFLGDLVMGRNIDEATKGLAESFSTFFFRNLVPALGRIMVSLPSVLFTFIATGIPNLIQGMTEIVPQIAESFSTALSNIGQYFGDFAERFANDPSVASGALELVKNFGIAVAKALPQILTGIVNLFDGVLNGLSNIIGSLMQRAMNRMLQPIKNAYNSIKSVIAKIKSLFNITLKFKGIKLPHIKVSWNKKGNLAKIASKLGLPGVPDFGVNWYKTGGIFDSPSIIGVGEAGREAVIPLDRLNEFTQPAETALDYDRLATAIARALNGATGDIIVKIDKDVLVKTTAPLFRRELNTLDSRTQRKLGYTGG